MPKRPKHPPHVQAAITRKIFEFGQMIKQIRKEQGLRKQSDFAEKIGINQQTSSGGVSKIETGRRSLSFANMISYARALGYDLRLEWVKLEGEEKYVISPGKSEEPKQNLPIFYPEQFIQQMSEKDKLKPEPKNEPKPEPEIDDQLPPEN